MLQSFIRTAEARSTSVSGTAIITTSRMHAWFHLATNVKMFNNYYLWYQTHAMTSMLFANSMFVTFIFSSQVLIGTNLTPLTPPKMHTHLIATEVHTPYLHVQTNIYALYQCAETS